MASGHMNRVKRPDTWLHRPMLQNVKKVPANPEPSTHDPSATCRIFHFSSPALITEVLAFADSAVYVYRKIVRPRVAAL